MRLKLTSMRLVDTVDDPVTINSRPTKKRSYEIWYEVPTANGGANVHRATNLTEEEFERCCNECEKSGYKIVLCNNNP